MPEGLMREPASDRVSGDALGPATPAPRVGLAHSALDDRLVGVEVLPGRGESELVETAEGREISGLEGSVEHVEVFRMGSVRTSIIERPRPISTAPHRGTALLNRPGFPGGLC